MEIIFKNSLGASKGKQCEEFLSILKKLKFQISTKDKMLNFYVGKLYIQMQDKQKKRFIMTTFSNRNLEDPPAGSPLVFVDFQFGDDMFNLASYAFDKPSMFSFDIEDLVKLTNHYYETKMSILKIQILSDFTNGLVQFQVPDEVEGGVPLVVQRLTQFPHAKSYQNKDHIDYFPLFELNDDYFEKLKEIEDIKYTCCYHIHEQGIYLKNYASKIQDDLFKYDSVAIKQKLRGNVYIQQADNYLIEEIKIAVKKHYKKMTVNLIVVRRPEQREFVKFSYIQIEAHLALFPKTIKRIICNCEISSEINPEGFLVQQSVPQSLGNNLLKNQQPVLQGLRRVVFNRWAPDRATDYFDEKAQLQREREVQMQRRQIVEETKTRKIKYKLEDD